MGLRLTRLITTGSVATSFDTAKKALPNSRKSRVNGRAGLGLSIARELARAHGGDLTLARTQPDWTEFCLRLSAVGILVQTQKPPPKTQK
jgi:signal transduction histidine kinase